MKSLPTRAAYSWGRLYRGTPEELAGMVDFALDPTWFRRDWRIVRAWIDGRKIAVKRKSARLYELSWYFNQAEREADLLRELVVPGIVAPRRGPREMDYAFEKFMLRISR